MGGEVGYSRATSASPRADGTCEREERSDDTRAVRVGDRVEESGTTATDDEGNIVGEGQ